MMRLFINNLNKIMEIIHRITGEVICESEKLSVKELAEQNKAALEDADLSGANLNGAALEGANLTGADLRAVDLRGAALDGAIFGKSKEFKSSQENPKIVADYEKKILELEEQIKCSPENLRLREKIELAKKFIGQVAEDHQGTMTGTAAKHFLFNYENNT